MFDIGFSELVVVGIVALVVLGPEKLPGAIRTATITHGLRRRKQKYGMVSMCVGTGMGAAGIFEAM